MSDNKSNEDSERDNGHNPPDFVNNVNARYVVLASYLTASRANQLEQDTKSTSWHPT